MSTVATSTPRGYQRWPGTLSRGWWTWLAIVHTGIRQASRGQKTRVLILSVSGVVLGGGGVMYALSLIESLAQTHQVESLTEFVRVLLGVDISGVARIGDYREILWRALFLLMIRIELVWVLLVVARVAPGLVANDLKHRALPIYFSKPVTPLTYIAGKLLIVAVFVALVTIVANLATLAIGWLLGGGLPTWSQGLNLAGDMVLSGLVVCLVGGAIGVALSSTCTDSRYATVAWFAVCLVTFFGQVVVDQTLPAELTNGWLGCISLRDNVVTVSEWLFDLRATLEASDLPAESFSRALVKPVRPACAATVLAVYAAAALGWTYWRVVTFSRSAANV